MAEAPDDGVIVDVVFEDGLLYLELANLAMRPALEVACTFNPALTDLRGRDVSELALFKRVEYLAPARRIRTLLDTSAGYFSRGAPERVTVTTRFRRPEGKPQTVVVSHDLTIYRDLVYV